MITLTTLQSLIAEGESETLELKRSTAELKRAAYTSLYAKDNPESRIWRSTAREAFDNRVPKDDTLRVLEYVPKGTKLVDEVELPRVSSTHSKGSRRRSTPSVVGVRPARGR